jgi:hypothetical protein
MIQQKRVQPFATIVVGATCIAIVSYGAWISHQGAPPEGGSAKIETNLPLLTLQQISSLDQRTFENSMSQLRQAIENPSLKAGISQGTLAAITAKLRQTSETTPAYWPTALRFIQFASSWTAQNAPPPGQQTRVLSEILSVGLMRGILEKGKTILLDDGYLGNGEFTDCRIIFTPNPVRLTHALFRNCVFEIPTADPPNAYIRKVCRILVSSNLKSVSIPAL